MIWFWVPASLVICNDVFAYIWGITTGRTPLIELSPKKTVEGFVGAFFSTMLFSVVWGAYFARFDYMICPVHELGANAFNSFSCVPNPVFVWREFIIPTPVAAALTTLVTQSLIYFGHFSLTGCIRLDARSLPSPGVLTRSIHLPSPSSPRLLPPLVASLRQGSNEPSTSRISDRVFLVTEA